jgi:hypothetical protein
VCSWDRKKWLNHFSIGVHDLQNTSCHCRARWLMTPTLLARTKAARSDFQGDRFQASWVESLNLLSGFCRDSTIVFQLA